MKKRYYVYTITIIIILLLSFLFVRTRDKRQITQYEIKEISLTLNAPRSGSSIIINNNLELIYQQSAPAFGILKERNESTITREEWEELVQMIIESNFFISNPRYPAMNPRDATQITITAKALHNNENRTHSVSCVDQCKGDFGELSEKMRELWGHEMLEVKI